MHFAAQRMFSMNCILSLQRRWFRIQSMKERERERGEAIAVSLTLARPSSTFASAAVHKKFQKNRETICIYQKKATRCTNCACSLLCNGSIGKRLRGEEAGKYSTIEGIFDIFRALSRRHMKPITVQSETEQERSFKKVNNWILRIYLLSLAHCFAISLLWYANP